jgi:hypothetical protein
MLVRTFAQPQLYDRRYSPAECTGVKQVTISGNPDEAMICTSHIDRQNLTMPMGIQRFTRLTNAASMKVEHHKADIALHFSCYNFGRIHQSLRVASAQEGGDRQPGVAPLELLA